MRTIAEIQADVRAALDQVKTVDATNAEALEGAKAKLNSLMQELDAAKTAEAAEQALVSDHLDKEARKGNNFSLLRFIRCAANGRMDGLEGEIAAEGVREYERLGLSSQRGYVIPLAVLNRAASGQNAGTAADGGYAITINQRFIEDVKERLTVVKMGATVLNDLEPGQLNMPSFGAVTTTFLDEAASASAQKSTVAKVTLVPRGLRTYIPYTRDLAKQVSPDVEAILIRLLEDSVAAGLDKAALAAVVTAATQPAGGTSLSWANVVAMETTINSKNANRGNLGYILPAASWGAAKTTLKSSGVGGYILEDNGMINGYKADFSNQFAANTPVFGNWADLVLGRWGGLDILVNPFTNDDTGEIRVNVYQYADAKVAFAKSFAKLTIAAGSGSGV